jgi:guanine nucleotide-binding protein subunit alpha
LGAKLSLTCISTGFSFFSEIKRLAAGDYLPNEQDVLRARIKTTGIIETRFTMGQLQIQYVACWINTSNFLHLRNSHYNILMRKNYPLKLNSIVLTATTNFWNDGSMFDVGGQRSERKKWIHCFEAVTSIIFCVSLSEYDQTLLEDSSQNRMAESLVLFESVINSRWFLRSSIILFLNKVDLFKDKLTKIPLSKYFEDFTGGDDLNKAAKYVLCKFTLLNRAKLKIYPHLTCATDTSNIRLGTTFDVFFFPFLIPASIYFTIRPDTLNINILMFSCLVFAAVKDTILQNALKDSGIL